MSEEPVINKIIDVLLDDAAKSAADKIGQGYPEPEQHVFSKEHEDKMRKLFRKEKNKLLLNTLCKYSRRVALFMLALVIVSSVAIFSVQAWRVRFLNFILERTQTHTEIRFKEVESKSSSFSVNDITINYIPAGFELIQNNSQKNHVSLMFEYENDYIRFIVNKASGNITIDTENADVSKTQINGMEGIYSAKEGSNILLWHDDEWAYTLAGNIAKEEIFKIATNITR